jgi:hypothetical protein
MEGDFRMAKELWGCYANNLRSIWFADRSEVNLSVRFAKHARQIGEEPAHFAQYISPH